jgi:hypothetical protein
MGAYGSSFWAEERGLNHHSLHAYHTVAYRYGLCNITVDAVMVCDDDAIITVTATGTVD